MNIKNFIYKFAIFFRRKLLTLLDASTVGVRAIVINDKNEILLVKHTYSKDWYLPGGGVAKNETASAAIIRELFEETGVKVITPPKLLNIYFHQILGVNDYPILYLVNSFTQEKVSSPEIATISWFKLDKLPDDISPATQKRLNEYFLNEPITELWK